MKISTVLVATFLTWVTFDRNLFRRRGERYASPSTSLSFETETEARREIKEFKQCHREVIPPWFNPGKQKLKSKVNHFCAKSKDPRFSNQRKIRRMFNNM